MADRSEPLPAPDDDPVVERTSVDGRPGTIIYFNLERGTLDRIPVPKSQAECFEMRFDDGSGMWGSISRPRAESPRKARARRLAELEKDQHSEGGDR